MTELSASERSSPDSSPDIITAADVAEILNVPTSFIYHLSKEGRIPTIRFGRYVRYDRHTILAWIPTQQA